MFYFEIYVYPINQSTVSRKYSGSLSMVRGLFSQLQVMLKSGSKDPGLATNLSFLLFFLLLSLILIFDCCNLCCCCCCFLSRARDSFSTLIGFKEQKQRLVQLEKTDSREKLEILTTILSIFWHIKILRYETSELQIIHILDNSNI